MVACAVSVSFAELLINMPNRFRRMRLTREFHYYSLADRARRMAGDIRFLWVRRMISLVELT